MQLPKLATAIAPPEDQQLRYALRGIGALLKDRPLFAIPSYQRSFAWADTQIDDLWADVIGALADGVTDYFLGSIVLTPADDGNGVNVIDGQQRLTAVTLMLSAVRDALAAREDTDRAKTVEEYLFRKDPITEHIEPRLRLGGTDAYFFLETVLKRPTERSGPDPSTNAQRRLAHAFARIGGKVQELVEAQDPANWAKALAVLWVYLETNVRTLVLDVSDDANAYLIFETLNDRGAELTLADLLKNFLFGRATAQDFPTVQAAWEQAMSTLEIDESKRTTFLRHHWSSLHGRTTEKLLYQRMKDALTGPDDVREYAVGLDDAARVYSAIENTGHSYWVGPHAERCRQAIQALLTLDAQQVRPLLIALMQEWRERRGDLASALEAVVNWHVRTLVVGRAGGGAVEVSYSDLAKGVRSGTIANVQDLRSANDFVPEDAFFEDQFAVYSVAPSKMKVARYLLAALEHQEQPSNEFVVNSNSSDVNLEHILPKSARMEEWPAFTADQAKSYLNRIGNLVLLLATENTAASNAPFATKVPVYTESKLEITQGVAAHDGWSPTSITERQRELATKAVTCWRR